MAPRFKDLLVRIFKRDACPSDADSHSGPLNADAELGGEGASLGARDWIGVDLDGTLAVFDGWKGFDNIGEPIPGMKARVLDWVAQGICVKVFTSRASVPEGVEPVRRWLAEKGFPPLEITCQKDFHLIEVWDDRAIQVVKNTGSPVLSAKWEARPRSPLFGVAGKIEKRAGKADAAKPESGTGGQAK